MSSQTKTCKFLYEASCLLPATNLYSAIRSSMMAKSLEIPSTNAIHIKVKPRCQSCGCVFTDVPPVSFLKPSKYPNRFVRRLLKSSHVNMTKYQNRCLKKFNKYTKDIQTYVFQCKLCKKQYNERIQKPDDVDRTYERSVENNESTEINQTGKKKKKKKKEFSGLNKSAVLAVKRQFQETTDKPTKKCEESAAKRVKINTPDVVINLDDSVDDNVINFDETITISPEKNLEENDSLIVLGDSPEKLFVIDKEPQKVRNLNDMFTPIYQKTNILLTNNNNNDKSSEVRSSLSKKKRKKNASARVTEVIDLSKSPDQKSPKKAAINGQKKQNKSNSTNNSGNFDRVAPKPINSSVIITIPSVMRCDNQSIAVAKSDKKSAAKNKQNKTPMKKNVVLVSETNNSEKKQKKLNNLASFLKQNGPKRKTTTSLQDFLSSIN